MSDHEMPKLVRMMFAFTRRADTCPEMKKLAYLVARHYADARRDPVERAVRNSPPPLDDVGGDVSFMRDEKEMAGGQWTPTTETEEKDLNLYFDTIGAHQNQAIRDALAAGFRRMRQDNSAEARAFWLYLRRNGTLAPKTRVLSSVMYEAMMNAYLTQERIANHLASNGDS